MEEGKRAGHKGKKERKRVVRTMVIVVIFLRLTNWSILCNWENGLSYSTYVYYVVAISFRLSGYFCMTSLYFLGKYDIVVAIVVVAFCQIVFSDLLLDDSLIFGSFKSIWIFLCYFK